MSDSTDGRAAGASREDVLLRTFVDLANELVGDYEVVDMLARLTTNCAQLLDIASAGLLLADGRGTLHLVSWSSPSTHDIQLFELAHDAGPCVQSYRSGEIVAIRDLGSDQRWPSFSRFARDRGLLSVHALPMRLHGGTLGSLALFGDGSGVLSDADLLVAQALLHVASIAVVNETAAADRDLVNAQLQRTLTSRVVFEQAKGVLAHAGDVSMETASSVLRRYSQEHGQRLADVAAAIVRRELSDMTLFGPGSPESKQ